MTVWDSLAAAIAIEEGFHLDGSPAQRNHNPGNLMTLAMRLASYADDATGWTKLYSYLQRHFASYPQISLVQFFGGAPALNWPGYAPAGHGNNDPVRYAADVAAHLTADGFPASPNSLLGEIASGTTSGGGFVDPGPTVETGGGDYGTITNDSGVADDSSMLVYAVGGAGILAMLLGRVL